MTDLATQGSGDLRASLESAFDSASADTSTAQSGGKDTSLDDAQIRSDGSVIETPEQKADRVRDEAGRFAKTAAEKAEVKLGADGKPLPEQKALKKLPNSWKREVAAVWDKVDTGETLTAAEVDLLRDEAIRREGDFHTGIEKYKGSADTAARFEQAYRPYEATIRQLGITPDVAAAHLFKVDHQLRHGDAGSKAQMVAQLIQQYGVDPNHVFSHFQPKQEVAPELKPVYDELAQLRKENGELKQSWQTQQQGSQERELSNFSNEITKFSQGKEHFQAVFDDMVALLPLSRGALPNANTQEVLQDAYDRAIWARPDLRATLLEQQTKAAEAKARADIQAQRAKTAASSVKGSSPVAGGATAPNNTVREALLAAMGEHT